MSVPRASFEQNGAEIEFLREEDDDSLISYEIINTLKEPVQLPEEAGMTIDQYPDYQYVAYNLSFIIGYLIYL